MKELTLLKMLDTGCYDSILKLKIALIRFKNMGLVFYDVKMSELDFDQPFEFYFHAKKGTITYQNAFPIPASYYKPWMSKKENLEDLLPYFQTFYESIQPPDPQYFKNLSHFRGDNYVWFYKEGAADA